MNHRIDHFMYAVPSLDEGLAWAADTFDAPAVYGGEHIGLGTRNALLSLGETYLEIIAPDPAQTPLEGLGLQFSELTTGGLVTWAVQGRLLEIAQSLQQSGIDTHGPHQTRRKTTEGDLLEWELLFPSRNAHGARLPFFIDWLDCVHPSKTTPLGGRFSSLSISDPNPESLQFLLDNLGLAVRVLQGPPGMHLSLETLHGNVTLTTTEETNTITMR